MTCFVDLAFWEAHHGFLAKKGHPIVIPFPGYVKVLF